MFRLLLYCSVFVPLFRVCITCTVPFSYHCCVFALLFHFCTPVPFLHDCSVFVPLFRLCITVPFFVPLFRLCMTVPFSYHCSVFALLFLFVPLFRFCITVPFLYHYSVLFHKEPREQKRNSVILYHCSVFLYGTKEQ